MKENRTKSEMAKISSMEESRKANSQRAMSGEGMDRKIERKKSWPKKIGLPLIFFLLFAYFIYEMIVSTGSSLSIDQNKIQIASVVSGVYEDFIPVRGRVTPAKTLYLDAIEGGRVERILVEDGASLKTGDLIVELSNASLQLSVLGNEARVAEQLNNMRSIELSLEQNRLQHKRNLIDIRYQIKTLSRQLKKESKLIKTGAVSQTQLEDTQDTLEWYENRLAITLESQASDQKMQAEQLTFITETSQRLENNLAISQQNLENMNVKAPVNGKLSGFDIEVGQSIGRGERLGQIDTPNDFKITTTIDEFYLSRVDLGQNAQYDDYKLIISKIYPQVQNGQFKIDFVFVGRQPTDIRRGQTIQTKLILGDASNALLIPNGTFFQETGGNWIYVVSNNESQAIKRTIKLGRRNSRYIEVLDGLQEGEKVIVSPYDNFQEMQKLQLNN